MKNTIKFRRDSLSAWQTVNPTLQDGEIALVDKSNGNGTPIWTIRVGNGNTDFNNLPEMAYALSDEVEQITDQLCAGLSTKIYIENPDEELSNYSDLSVVKISKYDYELLVAKGNVNPRTIYEVSSDVIDAYGEKIINVQDATDISDAVNLNVLSSKISEIGFDYVSLKGTGGVVSILTSMSESGGIVYFGAEKLKPSMVSGLVDTIGQANSTAGTAQSTANGALQKATDIESLIPEQALSTNQLADKAFVNSSVQTATANFRGNWATWMDVPSDASEYPLDYAGSRTPTVNDYMVVQDASGYVTQGGSAETYEGTWRFKYSGVWSESERFGWLPEYQVNETPMTAAQLAAINSNITASKVAQYDEALTKLNYALHTATMPAPYIPSNMYPITYEASDMTFTINESDWGSSLNIADVGGSYILTHHNSTFDVDITLCYISYSGKYGGDADVNNIQFNGVTPTTGVTQVLTIAAGYELEDRAVNTITVDPLHYTCPLVFPTLIPNHARDFIVRIYAYAGNYTPTMSASGVTLMNAEGTMPEIATDENAAKTTLVYFSEIAANIFLVKGEALETIS